MTIPFADGPDVAETRLNQSCGGEEEDRTPDLRIANATLSQLSYPPTSLRSLAKSAAGSRRVDRMAHGVAAG